MTFEEQIEALTGLAISTDTNPTQTQVTQYLTDGAKEVVNALPKNLLALCSKNDTFTSQPVGSEANLDSLVSGKIIAVMAGNYEARRIPSRLKHEANDSASMMYATNTDPVFYIQNNYLNVLPAGTSSVVDEVAYPTVAFSDSAIDLATSGAPFPDELEYLVVLFASMRALQNKIGSIEIAPNTSDSSGSSETLTTDMEAITDNQIGTDADFDDFDKWFVALGEMIEDDEDIELAGAQIEKINSYVNTWNIQLQGNSAEMQRYMSTFQAVKADYNYGISVLRTGSVPKQRPQKAEPEQRR